MRRWCLPTLVYCCSEPTSVGIKVPDKSVIRLDKKVFVTDTITQVDANVCEMSSSTELVALVTQHLRLTCTVPSEPVLGITLSLLSVLSICGLHVPSTQLCGLATALQALLEKQDIPLQVCPVMKASSKHVPLDLNH